MYEDARIRVVRLQIEPSEALPAHGRPRRVIIPLTTSVVNSTRLDGRTGPSRALPDKRGGANRRCVRSSIWPIRWTTLLLTETSQRSGQTASTSANARAKRLSRSRFRHWVFENQYVRVHLHALDSVFVRVTGGLVASQDQRQKWTKAERLEPDESRSAPMQAIPKRIA